MDNNEKYESLKLDRQLCFPLYAVSKEIVRKYKPFLDEIDLTYTQYITMMVLWEDEELLIKEIGARLFLDSGTLTPVLKELEKKGYVHRRRSESDRRDVYAALTKKGLELKERAADIPEKVGSCITIEPQKAIELYTILREIMKTM